MPKATVTWQSRALAKHKQRAKDIRFRSGDASMMKYLDDIEHVEKTLADQPRAGKPCPTKKRPLLRQATSSQLKYSVFYTIDDPDDPTEVVIIATGKGIPIP